MSVKEQKKGLGNRSVGYSNIHNLGRGKTARKRYSDKTGKARESKPEEYDVLETKWRKYFNEERMITSGLNLGYKNLEVTGDLD